MLTTPYRGLRVRYNDLLATVLSTRPDGARNRSTLWRQGIDLLAQFDGSGVPAVVAPDLDRLCAMLEELQPQIPVADKLAALTDLGGRLRSRRLMYMLLGDDPRVLVAAMNRARLADADWPEIVGQAGPLARSVLRRRRDLGPAARRALDAFGTTDLALTDLRVVEQPAVVEAEEVTLDVETPAPSQIRHIVDRIERFTSHRQKGGGRAVDATSKGQEIVGFTLRTDAEGMIVSVAGAPAVALVGLSLARAALDRGEGPDGQVLGAFRRRGAFRNGRLAINEGLAAGEWLIDGDPMFDFRTGRFTGYRASARRAGMLDQAPRLTPETARTQATPATPPAASIRQLIHELRTPLTGVMGFAELIESQILGPVNDRYRGMAGDIVSDVRNLVDLLDDLDSASRGDARRPADAGRPTHLDVLVREALATLDENDRLTVRVDSELPSVDVADPVMRRIILHLVRALLSCAGTDRLEVALGGEETRVELATTRPVALRGLTEAQLFDSGFEHADGRIAAPPLGLGFTLRLVRRLAEANHGTLLVEAERIVLTLPAIARDAGEASHRN